MQWNTKIHSISRAPTSRCGPISSRASRNASKNGSTPGLYAKIQAARTDAPKFVLHDGPPFANGDVHIGTALNKILKDIIIKYQTLRGKNAPYIPGWDCHGLPIEFKVSQDMRKAGDTSADAATIRKACEAYARKYIDLQREQFKRLGVLGDWGKSVSHAEQGIRG